jgi:hypothetical protein
MLKVIVDASHASAIAWRRLPAPLSALLTTTGSVVQTGVRVEVLIAEAYFLDDGVFRPLSLDAAVTAALSEALEVKLPRAPTKIMHAKSVARKTKRATKTPRWVREKGGLICYILCRKQPTSEESKSLGKGIAQDSSGAHSGHLEKTLVEGSLTSNSVGKSKKLRPT